MAEKIKQNPLQALKKLFGGHTRPSTEELIEGTQEDVFDLFGEFGSYVDERTRLRKIMTSEEREAEMAEDEAEKQVRKERYDKAVKGINDTFREKAVPGEVQNYYWRYRAELDSENFHMTSEERHIREHKIEQMRKKLNLLRVFGVNYKDFDSKIYIARHGSTLPWNP